MSVITTSRPRGTVSVTLRRIAFWRQLSMDTPAGRRAAAVHAAATTDNVEVAKRSTGRPARTDPTGPCPCGLGEPFADCCGPLHRGVGAAPTAESLMRSRFSAFAVGDEAYLLRTWHPTTRPRRVRFDPRQRWTRLQILRTSGGGLLDGEGRVEFRAHSTRLGEPDVQHEHSQFARHDGQWVYVGPAPTQGVMRGG